MHALNTCSVARRLLRNRVSAQQARERKKSYVSNLENTNKEQAQRVRTPPRFPPLRAHGVLIDAALLLAVVALAAVHCGGGYPAGGSELALHPDTVYQAAAL